ncbi:MAG TPA: class I SAM-dependent methyltransferase [Polyangia bacterium]|jgi:predicted O-methyltransferase YrrM
MNLRAIAQNQLHLWIRRSFPLWQRLGVHVVPNHFYFPIPDTRTLDDRLWEERSELPGIDMRAPAQLQLLSELAAGFRAEYDALPRTPTGVAHEYHLDNGLFGPVDAEMLYAMIRKLAPKRIYEVGSGFSTYLAAQAVRKNEADGKTRSELVAFEPYPNPVLAAGVPGVTRLERIGAQQIPLSTFAALEENDILFIDSSHIVKIGSDVNYLILDVLPRLRPGVVVHIHDIFLPFEYPKSWVKDSRTFFNEQYLLQAFLAFNGAFEVILAGSYLAATQPAAMSAAFRSFQPGAVGPGSFWIRRRA